MDKERIFKIAGKILKYIFFNLLIIVITIFILHTIRFFRTAPPAGSSGPAFVYLSLNEILESCKSDSIILGMIITCALGYSTANAINNIGIEVKKNWWLTWEVKQAAKELVLQARNSIPHFDDVWKKAEKMMENVDSKTDSEVKLALFWPMFGADLGESFQKNNGEIKTNFFDKTENPFYYYLFRRIKHNMPTELLFLEYEDTSSKPSVLLQFN